MLSKSFQWIHIFSLSAPRIQPIVTVTVSAKAVYIDLDVQRKTSASAITAIRSMRTAEHKFMPSFVEN